MMMGWPPSEFWSASLYEITTAIVVNRRMHTPAEQQPMDDDALWSFLDGVAAKH